jgi:hypothetical protein
MRNVGVMNALMTITRNMAIVRHAGELTFDATTALPFPDVDL